MKFNRIILICFPLFSFPFLADFFFPIMEETYHSEKELDSFRSLQDSLLPEEFNSLFTGSGTCIDCHGYDTAGIASVDILGSDINLVDDWRATMMANSAKDPFWRAKVSHETQINPHLKESIETKCTSCHAPLGHFNALHEGRTTYSIQEMIDDPLALDGVSCLSCHQQSELDLGNLHSGHLNFDTNRVAYGPFISPLASVMILASEYEPMYSEHISDAGICAGCHTLVTETVNELGESTGNQFVEQATYHEWLNSAFSEENISCQSCHMPTISKGDFYLAAGFETEERNPFYLHDLTGSNSFMLKLLKDNIETLSLTATAEQFDEVIAKTNDILRFETLDLELTSLERTGDTAFFQVKLSNKAGHKFPSGYPSRRAFVTFLVLNSYGDTLFVSGKLDENFELSGLNTNFEPHYQTIRAEDEVQIYEMVPVDLNGQFTSVLLREANAIKDNRLPPRGFTTNHSAYDTTKIEGLALQDQDFNLEEGEEGSGSDLLYYNVPMNGNLEALQVSAKVFYQVLPPRWANEIFETSSSEIELFSQLYEAADKSPSLIAEASTIVDELVDTETILSEQKWIEAFAFGQGQLKISSEKLYDIWLYDASAKLMFKKKNLKGDYYLGLPKAAGLYILNCINSDGGTETFRFIRT